LRLPGSAPVDEADRVAPATGVDHEGGGQSG
jgi:hypothetical protein